MTLSLATKGYLGGSGPLSAGGYYIGSIPTVAPVIGNEIENFSIRRGFEGAQIILNWTYPLVNPPISVKIIRRRGSFPKSIIDGVEVLDTTSATEFADIDLQAIDYFYYSVFSEISAGVFAVSKINQGKEIAFDTGFFEDRIFLNYLIPPARIEDRNSDQLALNQSTIPNDGEIVNLREDGTLDKGELRRFIKLFSLSMDEIRELIRALETLPDADRVCSDYLEQLAAIVGVEFNPDIDILRQRDEIKRAVEVYKTKGTEGGIESIAESISGSFVDVHENVKNMFIFNDIKSTFIDEDDTLTNRSFNKPGDLIARWLDTGPDRIYSPDKIFVYILLKKGEPFPSEVLNKLNRVLPDFVPINIGFLFVILEEPCDEELKAEIPDESDDIITSWLEFNTLVDEFSDSDAMFAGDVGYRI